MKIYATQIKAFKPGTNDAVLFAGPNVRGISMTDAKSYCENNGLGYCEVVGELIAEIPCKNGTYDPNFENAVDFENRLLN